jgi:uncharacterized membrane protein YeiH
MILPQLPPVSDLPAEFEFGPILAFLNIASIALFAASGAVAAARKNQTIVTFAFFGLLTGLGGGTLRDIVIDAPVFWLDKNYMAAVALVSATLVWFVPSRWWRQDVLKWLDAAALAAFAVFGAAKSLQWGVGPMPAVLMGVVTACAGGILRDVVSGEPSIMLGPELYVSCAFLSAAAFVLLETNGIGSPVAAGIAAIAGFSLRAAAIRFNWSLPSYRGDFAQGP